MRGIAVIIAAVVVLAPVAGFAEQRAHSDFVERVLDYLYPHRSKRVPLPAPDIPPPVVPVPMWHDPPRFEPVPVQPPIMVVPKVEAPKPLPQVRIAKPKRKSEPLKPQPRQQPKTPDVYDNATLYPCSWVCWHVNGKSKAQLLADKTFYRPTPRQEAHGRACVVNTCPGNVPVDVLAEMKRDMGRR